MHPKICQERKGTKKIPNQTTRWRVIFTDLDGLAIKNSRPKTETTPTNDHQQFQVPKMEGFLVTLLKRLFWGWKFSLISRIHTAYIGEDSSILGT